LATIHNVTDKRQTDAALYMFMMRNAASLGDFQQCFVLCGLAFLLFATQSTEGTYSTQTNQTYNNQTINTKHSKSPSLH